MNYSSSNILPPQPGVGESPAGDFPPTAPYDAQGPAISGLYRPSTNAYQVGSTYYNVTPSAQEQGTPHRYSMPMSSSGATTPVRSQVRSWYGGYNGAELSTTNPAYPSSPQTPSRRPKARHEYWTSPSREPSRQIGQSQYMFPPGSIPPLNSSRNLQPPLAHSSTSPLDQANYGSLAARMPMQQQPPPQQQQQNIMVDSQGRSLSQSSLYEAQVYPPEYGQMYPQQAFQPPLPPQAVRPVMNPITDKNQLMPVPMPVPKYRRALPEGGFVSPLMAVTTYLTSTYHICDPNFNYSLSRNPRRILTEPREGKLNNGFDNEESDYILWVNDILGTDDNRRYLVLNVLGKGTFGQVVKCQNMLTKEVVAVKVIKNKPAYLNQSMMEVSILEHIQTHVDKDDRHNLLRLKDKFVHKEHLCLVFELLSSNLYEVIRKNQFHGLSISLVRTFATQLLDSLSVLKNARLIHCDLKPENILLKRSDSTTIKIIDFGSACHERQTVYTYIQSRFYRSPEVILGLPYTSSIDMWSLGCIIAELFLGLPIFPGTSEYNQWSRIVDSLGLPPNWMIEMGKNSDNFVKKYTDEHGQKRFRLRTRKEQTQEFGGEEKPSKQYFSSTDIRQTIMTYPLPSNDMSKEDIAAEMEQREALADFIKGLLNFNPFERWTPQQAIRHPFITGCHFTQPYIPGPPRSEEKQLQGFPEYDSVPAAIPPQQPTMADPYSLSQKQQRIPSLQTQQYQRKPARARAATIGQPDPVPGPIQRAAAMVNPANAIHAQASPAYVPPPEIYKNQPFS